MKRIWAGRISLGLILKKRISAEPISFCKQLIQWNADDADDYDKHG